MNPSRSTIYMADDDADDRYFIRQALQMVDPSLTIVVAEDGGALLDLLQGRFQDLAPQPVHLILLDMNMPRVNGLETLVMLKANPALRHIPTVMISTAAEPEQVATAYQNGISSYIQKPVSAFELSQIAQALKVCFLDAAVRQESVIPKGSLLNKAIVS